MLLGYRQQSEVTYPGLSRRVNCVLGPEWRDTEDFAVFGVDMAMIAGCCGLLTAGLNDYAGAAVTVMFAMIVYDRCIMVPGQTLGGGNMGQKVN